MDTNEITEVECETRESPCKSVETNEINANPGKSTNRTVVTFIGPPDAVIEAAFEAIKKASELIDMTQHGNYPL